MGVKIARIQITISSALRRHDLKAQYVILKKTIQDIEIQEKYHEFVKMNYISKLNSIQGQLPTSVF